MIFPKNIKLSELADGLAPFYVMEMLERAKKMEDAGTDVVHLEVGEPHLRTPSDVCAAAVSSINKGETRYSPSGGIEALREEIAHVYNSNYGLKVAADNVMVTSGSSPALLLAILCLANPGDEIIITDPHYACYPGIIKAASAVPVTVEIYAEENYQIDAQRLKKALTPATKAIILNSPANPTGAVLDESVVESICSLGIFIISDEIYHGLEYGGKSKSILNHTDYAVVVNGFSKLCSMTGWRLGYMIAHEELIRSAQKIQQNLFISPNPFVQQGGLVALKKVFPQSGQIAATYSTHRDAMVQSLRGIGLSPCGDPRGAFYLFVKMPAGGEDSRSLAFDILEKSFVAVTPGIDFGSKGEGHLRFSYATSVENINKGIKRVGECLRDFS